jgi:hypothetical protein
MKTSSNTKWWQGQVENQSSCNAGRNVKWYITLEDSLTVPFKIKNGFTI